MDVLLDSSIVIASERGQLDLDAILVQHTADQFAVAATTVAELLYGVQKRPLRYRASAQAFINRLLAQLATIPFDRPAAEVHAVLRIALEKAGATMGHNDLQIAAVAIANDMAIAARDRDFGRIEGLTVFRW